MKFKKYLISIIVSSGTLSLIACNSGHESLPNANYGEVVSIKQQNYNGNKTFNIFDKNGESWSLFEKTLDLGSFASGLDTKYAYAKSNIKNTREDFNVDIKAFKNVSVSKNVEAYSVEYKTPGQNHDTDPMQIVRTTSGLVILPDTPDKKIRGIVLYFHPTEFGKSLVPSCINKSTTTPEYCNITADKGNNKGFNTFAYLASIYASRGFAVVAPDYLGMGSDWNNVHPYVAYPEINAISGFNMFPALRKILSERGIANTENLPLMITGFSEGAGYALKASELAQGKSAKILKDNHLELKITSPQEGAYSLQDQMDFAFADLSDGMFNCANKPKGSSFVCSESKMVEVGLNEENPSLSSFKMNEDVIKMNNWNIVNAMTAAGNKPTLTGYVLASSLYYDFNNLSSAYDFVMNHQFWSSIQIKDQVINLFNLFNGNGINYKDENIYTSLHENSLRMKNIEGISYNVNESHSMTFYLGGDTRGAASMLKSSGMSNPAIFPKVANLKGVSINMGYGVNNSAKAFINYGIKTSPQFTHLMQKGSTYNWYTTSPINFINMKYDSVVATLNFHQAYSCMKYGKQFISDEVMVSSVMPCNNTKNISMVESTTIDNAQLTNELVLLLPELLDKVKNASSYWASTKAISIADNAYTAVPMDHNNMFVLSNIVAMCTFENMLKDGKNSGKCPDLTK